MVLRFAVFFFEREIRVGTEKFHVALEVKAGAFIFHSYFENEGTVIIFFRHLEYQRLHGFRKRGHRKDFGETCLLQSAWSSI